MPRKARKPFLMRRRGCCSRATNNLGIYVSFEQKLQVVFHLAVDAKLTKQVVDCLFVSGHRLGVARISRVEEIEHGIKQKLFFVTLIIFKIIKRLRSLDIPLVFGICT